MIEDMKRFQEIVQKHKLFDEEKAEEIAHYITDHRKEGFSAEEFAKDFALPIEDAQIFLSVVYKGVALREKHIRGEDEGKD
jgi:hypothetical protein